VTAGVVLALIAGGLLTTQAPFFSSIRNPQSPIHNQAALPLPDKPSIVVLPFINMSDDPKQEYFSDGITEDLTTDLSKISSLFVIARNSAFTYKGKAVKVQDVSREMGVRYVLEGSVRRAGDQVRITGQLVDATTGYHLWSERYDRPLQDIFTLQDEITQQIATALRTEVLEAEQKRIRRIPTENLNAYETLLRGREYFSRFTKEANTQARQMYEKAIALDPQYAGAYAVLGFTYLVDWALQWSQDPQALERAAELAQKAITLDDSLPEAHILLGYVSLWKNRQHDLAIAEGGRALALDPNNAEGYATLANILTFAGRPEEAIALLEKGMRLNPRAPNYFFYLFELGHAYHWLGQYEKAIAIQKRVLLLNPNEFVAHLELAKIYDELGREEEARAEVAEALKLNPHYSLEALRERHPYKDPVALERYLAAMRKAGLK
jgi:adenylate cyclase